MEKKYRLLILLIFGFVFSFYIVDALSIYSPNIVNINEDFNLIISESGFYAVEMNIPKQFQIVLDKSNGVRTDSLYKTFASGSLTIKLRAEQIGTYTINGQYTTGDGIKDIRPITIQVNKPQVKKSCPICPLDSEWSNCENNWQIRIAYVCSSSTNFICVKSIESQECYIENEDVKICGTGWVCKDNNNLAYQSSDCSLSSIQRCSYKCNNSECIISKEKYIEENLTIDILPEGKKETLQSFLSKIIKFIIRIIDILIFWD